MFHLNSFSARRASWIDTIAANENECVYVKHKEYCEPWKSELGSLFRTRPSGAWQKTVLTTKYEILPYPLVAPIRLSSFTSAILARRISEVESGS